MTTAATPLNTDLHRVHTIFYVFFAALAVILLVAGTLALFRGGEGAGVCLLGLAFVPMGVAHWYAARGARDGKAYGRVLSRVFGSIWLIGFPIGTVLGIYVLSRTGNRWQGSAERGG